MAYSKNIKSNSSRQEFHLRAIGYTPFAIGSLFTV